MRNKIFTPFSIMMTVLTGLLMSFFLVGRKTTPAQNNASASKKHRVVSLNPAKVDAATFAGLRRGLSTELNGIGTIAFQQSRKRKMIISKVPLFKKLILSHEKATPTLHTLRPDLLEACQFIGVRIELDDRIETAEWLVTTQGKEACQPTNRIYPQSYWLLMHQPGQQPAVIASGRALSFQLWKKGKGELLKRFETNKYNRAAGVEILCYRDYKSQGQRYILREQRTEGYIHTPLIPEKTWQPVDKQKYRCRP